MKSTQLDIQKRYEWKIIDEKKIINGYNCIKAEAIEVTNDFRGKFENKITCWFTTELPSGFGPADFVGLPGLVIRAQKGNIIFYVKNIYDKSLSFKYKRMQNSITKKQITEIFNNGMNNYFND
ncbi:GLPGLI family protein [Mesonia aestuariivivens]|uniref:GLPGLI family protein n=1 Tax=Mesonia aestuariivivens TaxID=2796128 RepID=A0ABS6W182_9FLAO|nr:GLPGLI family protein [Mesonia aestuariivivens]